MTVHFQKIGLPTLRHSGAADGGRMPAGSSHYAALSIPLLPFIKSGRTPIVFSDRYDFNLPIDCTGLPFDFKKRSKVFNALSRNLSIDSSHTFSPRPVTDQQLATVHTRPYIEAAFAPQRAASVMGIHALATLDRHTIEQGLVDPIRMAVGGTLLALDLALDYGWAVNLSGGFHHAKTARGEGFCFFNDLAVAIQSYLRRDSAATILVVDVDAHPCNGLCEIFERDPRVKILDVFNADLGFSRHDPCRVRTDISVPVSSSISEQEYLERFQSALAHAVDTFRPRLIFYNAGVDVFAEDKLGRMRIGKDAIIERELLTFRSAFANRIPIIMVLSGGYSQRVPEVVADSLTTVVHQLTDFAAASLRADY